MTSKVLLQPAYLLHARAYRETSILAELFTQDFGRVSLVIKGGRQIRSRYRGMRAFTPFLISYQGKSDLFNLTDLESTSMPFPLMGQALFCGFYLNELLLRLLLPQDPYPELFLCYEHALKALSREKNVEPILRRFERSLLVALGYGFPLDKTTGQEPVLKDGYYSFSPKKGLTLSCVALPSRSPVLFKGECLLNFSQNRWENTETFLAAKRLMQLALSPLLGEFPLRTRQFFLDVWLGSEKKQPLA